MRYSELERIRSSYIRKHHNYKMIRFDRFDYSILDNCMYKYKKGRGKRGTYNDVIIMADTETSKSHIDRLYDEFGNPDPQPNHIVAWTVSIRMFHMNICTIYGTRPSEFIEALNHIREHLKGDDIYIYWHNLSYDWVFIRRFMFREFGTPKQQLNTKAHYPIMIMFENGIIFKDSLILSGCKLEKWANDLDVEHKKAVGSWDYDKVRDQGGEFDQDELHYIENDTLAGVECLDAYMIALNKDVYSIVYTATGIPREEVRERAAQNKGHDNFLRQALTFEQFEKMVLLYHGGYTYANRYFIDILLDLCETRCFDFCSSYPFCMLAFRYPSSKFIPYRDCDPEHIIKYADKYAFIFRISFINIKLKDDLEPMPALQTSKLDKTINLNTLNGRTISCGYCTILMCEQDLCVISEQYTWESAKCTEVEIASKDYLPRWFTDYVFEQFKAKQELKGGDKVLYNLQKARLNSLYGLTVTRSVREELIEVTEDGEYPINKEGDTIFLQSGQYRPNIDKDLRKEYEKYLKRKTSVLNYQIGVYVTAYAQRNLFELFKCVNRVYKNGKLAVPPHIYYTDTDSCYSDDWNYTKLLEYNQKCKERLLANGYGAVTIGDNEYWLGTASFDGAYSEYKVLGPKRYAGRSVDDNELHITVAGVPKKGAACLKDDLNNFTDKCIFDGKTTGKLTHYHIFHDIYIDEYGNEIGDSIDLQPCDYMMDSMNHWEFIEEEEVELQIFDESLEGGFI